MIPIKESRELVTSGAAESIAFGISAKDSIHIMGILRDQLYSDKIMAVLREIGANAQDANSAAGRRDRPIEVYLPTLADPTLRIRDHGPGLSLEDVRTVFSQYGASTKRDSNEVVGMLGIGSKSPFAYSDSFVVTSWHGGKVSIYNAVIDPSGAGQIDLLDVDSCDPNESGLEVSLAVRPADCKAFEERARRLYVHFDPRPVINTVLPSPGRVIDITDGFISSADDSEYPYTGGQWTVVMGCIPYGIDLNQLSSGTGGGGLTSATKRVSGTLRFPIGSLEVAASRESLKYGDATRRLLIARLNSAVSELTDTVFKDIDSLSNWEKRLRTSAIARRMGLPIPMKLRGFDESYVDLKPSRGPTGTPPPVINTRTFEIQNRRSYSDKMEKALNIEVSAKSQLVLCDDRRAIAGFALKPAQKLVRPSPGYAPGDLEGFCREYRIDGIPVIKLSSLPWTKPERAKGPITRDAERARARSFTLNMDELHDRSPSAPMSTVWDPRVDEQSNTDVFVVLEGYQALDHEQFYEWVKEDEAFLSELGLRLPPIVGHKSTKARPVTPSSCKGTEYHQWRAKELPLLLVTNAKVAQAARALTYVVDPTFYEPWFVGKDSTWISSELGEGHPLSVFGRNLSRSMQEIKGLSKAVVSAASRHKNQMLSYLLRPTGVDERKALVDRYPLLGVIPYGSLSGREKGLWIDYVKAIDSLEALKLENRKAEAA